VVRTLQGLLGTAIAGWYFMLWGRLKAGLVAVCKWEECWVHTTFSREIPHRISEKQSPCMIFKFFFWQKNAMKRSGN